MNHPLQIRTPVTGMNRVVVNCTGLTALEEEHMRKLVIKLGGAVESKFSKRCTHLVCKRDSQGSKIDKARAWNARIVFVQDMHKVAQTVSGDECGDVL
jgi:NAD-dependent DNA ligase